MLSLNRTIIIICFLTACSFDLSAQTTPTCGASCTAPITYTGNITLSTQADLNNFISGSCKYTHVVGNLIIDGNGNAGTGTDGAGIDPITDLCNLQELVSVTGSVTIRDFNVPGNPVTLVDLANLNTIGLGLTIGVASNDNNGSFTEIKLNGITDIGNVNVINIQYNPNATAIELKNLSGTVGATTISNNAAVSTIDIGSTGTGWNTSLNTDVTVSNNGVLNSVDFSSLTSVGSDLYIQNNDSPNLTIIDLQDLTTVDDNLTLDNDNENLSGATVSLPSLVTVGVDGTGTLTINDIATGTLDLKSLVTVNGTLAIDNNDNGLAHIQFENLQTILGDMNITGNNDLVSVTDAAGGPPFTIGIDLDISNNDSPNLTVIDLQDLTTVDDNLTLDNDNENLSGATVSLPSLVTVGVDGTGTLTINDIATGTLDLKSLVTVNGTLAIGNNDNGLAHIQFENLQIILGDMNITGNNDLVSVTDAAGGPPFTIGIDLDISNNDSPNLAMIDLQDLTTVDDNLTLDNDNENLSGATVSLPSLVTVGVDGTGTLTINDIATGTLDLKSLVTVNGTLAIGNNDNGLAHIQFENLQTILTDMNITGNNDLVSVTDAAGGPPFTIGQDLNIEANISLSLATIDFEDLFSVGRDISIDDDNTNSSGTEVTFPSLTSVGRDFLIYQIAKELSASNLNSIGRNFYINDNNALCELDMQALITVNGYLYINDNYDSCTSPTINFNNLITVGDGSGTDYLTILSNNAMPSVSFPMLTAVNGNGGGNNRSIRFDDNDSAVTLSFPLLTTIPGEIYIGNNLILDAVSVNSLSVVGEDLRFVSNPALTAINFLLLTDVTGVFEINNNDELPDLNGFGVLEEIGGNVIITGNGNSFPGNGSDLTSLDGLSSLTTIAGTMSVTSNPMLGTCCIIPCQLNSINGSSDPFTGNLTITGNLSYANGGRCIANGPTLAIEVARTACTPDISSFTASETSGTTDDNIVCHDGSTITLDVTATSIGALNYEFFIDTNNNNSWDSGETILCSGTSSSCMFNETAFGGTGTFYVAVRVFTIDCEVYPISNIAITVYELPTASITSDYLNICDGVVELNGNPVQGTSLITSAAHQWTQTAGPGTGSFDPDAISNPVIFNVTGAGSASFEYVVTDNYGCESLTASETMTLFAPSSTCGSYIYTGNVTFNSQTDLNAFTGPGGCRYIQITGDVTLNGNHATDPITDLCNLQDIVTITGDLTFRQFTNPLNPSVLSLANLETIGNGSGTDLLTIGGSLADQNTMFTNIDFPKLENLISGSIIITFNPGLTAIDMPLLESVTSSITINTNGMFVTSINLENLETVGGGILLNNNAANAINASIDLSSLTTVGTDIDLTRTADATSFELPSLISIGDDLYFRSNASTSFDAPLLHVVDGDIEFSNNAALTSIEFPTKFSSGTGSLNINNNTSLQTVDIGIISTSSSVTIQTNGTGVTAITLKELVSVGNDLTMNNTVAHAVNATVDLSKLEICIDDLNLTRTASSLLAPLVESVNDFDISYNSLTGALSFPNMEVISSDLIISNNPNITSISIPTLTGSTDVLNISGNTSLVTASIGVTAVTGSVTFQTNGTGVTNIDLSDLVTIGSDLSMNNIATHAITAAIDLSSLTTIGDDVNFTRAVGALLAGNLISVADDFTFTLNSAFTNFDTAFPSFASVGGNFSVTSNSSLAQCCVIPCQLVVSGTKTISGNTGNCQTLAIATSSCQVTVNITGSGNVCLNGEVILNGNLVGTDPPYTHNWSITGGSGAATFIDHGDGSATFTGTSAGTIEIEYFATGNSGCVSNTATFTLTVDPSPVLSGCSANLNGLTSSGGTGDCYGVVSITHPTVTAQASCTPTTLQVDYGLGGGWETITPASSAAKDFPFGTTTVNYQLLDVNSNTVGSCSLTVTVEDDENPTFTCPTPTLVLNTNGNSGCEVIIPDLVSLVNDEADNCGLALVNPVTQSIATGAYSGVSDGNIIPVTVTVTDAASPANSTNCVVTFTVNDDDAPTFTCPTPTLVLNTTGNSGCEVVIPDLVSMVTDEADNCGLALVNPVTQSIAAGVYSGVSDGNTIPVTVTVTDAASPANSTNCVVTFTVNDDDAPTFTCPTPTLVLNTTGNSGCEVNIPDLVSMVTDEADNCGLASVPVTQSIAAGAYSGVSDGNTIPVTVTVTDDASPANTTNCVVTFTVNDDDAPTFTCPTPTLVLNTTGNSGCEVEIPDLVSLVNDEADNCGLASVNPVTQSIAAGVYSGISDGNTIPVTITVTDESSPANSTNCVVTFIVNDDDAPTFTCPTPTLVLNTTGNSGCEVIIPDLVSMVMDEADNCGLALVNPVTQSIAAGVYSGVSDGNTIPVTVTVTDAASPANTTNCVVTFTVNDDDAPTFTCPTPTLVLNTTGNSGCEVEIPNLVSLVIDEADNCGLATVPVTQSIATGAYSGVSDGNTIPVTVTVTDAASPANSTNCVVTFTVNDDDAPTFTCPTPTLVLNTTGNSGCEVEIPDLVSLVNDEADNCGLASVNPVTQSIAAGAYSGVSDGNTIPVTVTVTDAASPANTTNCVVTFTVNDDDAPTFTCPPNITIYADASCAYDANPTITGDVTNEADNCIVGQATYADVLSVDLCPGTKYIARTWSLVDDAGNAAANQVQIITILDNTPPVLTSTTYGFPDPSDNPDIDNYSCGSTFNYTTGAGICFATKTITKPTWVDACGGTITRTHSANNSVVLTNFPGTPGHVQGNFPPGTTTVTFTGTDCSGNNTQCQVIITVTDDTDPTLTNCPVNQAVNTSPGLCNAEVTTIVPITTDNCGVTSITHSATGATVFSGSGFLTTHSYNAGMTSVTYAVEDAAGNEAVCSFTVTVTDAEPPAITCPSNISVNTDAGQCSAIVTYIAPVGTDNCSGATTAQTAGLGSVVAYPVGVTTNTFTVTAANLQTASCSFTVTVTDAELPVITCPSNISVNTGVGVCTTVVNYTTPVGTDNCPGATTAQTGGLSSGATYPLGVTTNTFTVTAANLQTASCSFTVTVTDNTPPSIVCPADQTVNLNASCSATMPAYSAVSTSDNCTGVISVVQSPAASTVYTAEGNQVVTLTATDANGNTNACIFNVYFDDVNAPVIAGCPSNQTVNTGVGNLTCTQTATWTAPSATDGCTAVSVVSTHSPGATFSLGTTTVSYTFSDGNGNSSVCSFTVTVIDNTVPVISCPSGVIVAADSGLCSAAGVTYAATATDNCSTPVIVHSPASGSTFLVGVTTVTATATDLVGNSSSCSFTVTVTDTQLPVITCPSNISVNTDTGLCSASVTYSTPVGTDNCAGAVTTQSTGLSSGSAFPIGTTTNTFVVTAANSQSASCSFTVTVTDAELPVITCPANISVNTDAGLCSATVTYSTPVGTDNCAGAVTTQTTGFGSGSNFPIGTTTNTFVVTAANSQSASCSFTVTVTDAEPPAITCPSNISVNTDAGLCSAVVTYIAPVGTDNCSGATTAQTAGLGSGVAYPVGVTTNTFTVTAANLQTASCSFTVTVTDAELPVITCPANISVNTGTGVCTAVVTYTAPVGTDNCPGATTAQTGGLSSGATYPLGVTTNTFTVTAANLQTASCSFTVTVTDNTPPSIVCPANQTVNLNASCSATMPAYSAVSTSDNCTGVISVVQSPAASTVYTAEGNQVVTLTATDANGNTNACTFNVYFDDVNAPVIAGCPSNQTVNTGVGNLTCTQTATWTAPSATDGCTAVSVVSTHSPGATFSLGTTTVSYTFNDGNGNSSVCSFTVTVIDNTVPVISCPSGVIVAADLDLCSAAGVSYAASATDNCSTPVIVHAPISGSTFAVGVTTVTATATDLVGNSSSCSFTVTVTDTQLPVITCPTPITIPASAGVCEAAVTYSATASDNCSVMGITYSPASGSIFSVGTTPVTATATDVNGNSSNCIFNVTVVDDEDPVITCPADITVPAAFGYCSEEVSFAATATDNCGVFGITYNYLPGSSFGVGTIEVTATATDLYGNDSSCTFDVTVLDTQAPVIAGCPGVITVYTGAGDTDCSQNATWTEPTAIDNCMGPVLWATRSHAPGALFGFGSTTVSYVFTDAYSNSSTCSFTVVVVDNTQPLITCLADQTVNLNASCSATMPAYSAVSTSDNCTGVISVVQSPAASTVYTAEGNQVVTLIATDANGNTNACTFNVYFDDVNAPVIAGCPSNQTVNTGVGNLTCTQTATWTAPSATDGCTAVSVVNTHSPERPLLWAQRRSAIPSAMATAIVLFAALRFR
ncbi:MAG: HYR domain-containing protein [Sphingobacteriales bacterium]|nr:MAG: HYR domain-containing protein [Sphingobacteriales bacterium]